MPSTLCPLSRCLTRGVRLRRPYHQLSTQLRHQCAWAQGEAHLSFQGGICFQAGTWLPATCL